MFHDMYFFALWGKGFQKSIAYVCKSKLSSARARVTSSIPNPAVLEKNKSEHCDANVCNHPTGYTLCPFSQFSFIK